MINAAVEIIDKLDKDRETAPYSTKNQLLTSYTEKRGSLVKFACRPAALAEWVEIIGAMMGFDSAGNE